MPVLHRYLSNEDPLLKRRQPYAGKPVTWFRNPYAQLVLVRNCDSPINRCPPVTHKAHGMHHPASPVHASCARLQASLHASSCSR